MLEILIFVIVVCTGWYLIQDMMGRVEEPDKGKDKEG